MLDHPNVTSVAIAATWPPGTRPVAILVSYTPYGPDPGPQRFILLAEPLSSRLLEAAGESPASGFTAGAFHLAPTATVWPGDPAGWLGHGWPDGTYRFEIELEGGVRETLPFQIGGPGAP
jgi:hypothetical protein